MNNGSLPLSVSFFAVFLCTLFGANAVAIKISLSGLGVFTTIALRFTLAATALFLYSLWRKQTLAIDRRQFLQMSIISFLFFFQMSCFYHGQHQTTASHGTLIANILPFVVMILAHFFLPDDKASMTKVLGLLLGFCGVAFLFAESAATGKVSLQGDLKILIAVLLWACNVTYIKKIISDYHPLQITFFPMILTVPLFCTAAFIWDRPAVGTITTEVVIAVLYQSFVTASFGFVMWNTLIQRYGATALHSFIFLMPLSGVFFGVLILGEQLSGKLGASIVLVTLGLIIVNFRFRHN